MKTGKPPLLAKTVLVTRASSQSADLRKALEKLGARVFDFPAIKIAPPKTWGPLDQALKRLDRLDWIVFTSVNGVESFMGRLRRMGKKPAALRKIKIAAIGESTAAKLSENGVRVRLQPRHYTSDGLFRELKRHREIRGQSFLLPRADIAPDIFPENLRKAGANVTQVTAYRTLPATAGKKTRPLMKKLVAGKIDFILFASSSTVRHFFGVFPKSAIPRFRTKYISIGPVTTQTLLALGRKPYREAKVCTMKGMIQALLAAR